MDVLGSIMKSMDKPPSLSEKEKLLIKSKFLIIISNKIDTFICRKERRNRTPTESRKRKDGPV